MQSYFSEMTENSRETLPIRQHKFKFNSPVFLPLLVYSSLSFTHIFGSLLGSSLILKMKPEFVALRVAEINCLTDVKL